MAPPIIITRQIWWLFALQTSLCGILDYLSTHISSCQVFFLDILIFSCFDFSLNKDLIFSEFLYFLTQIEKDFCLALLQRCDFFCQRFFYFFTSYFDQI